MTPDALRQVLNDNHLNTKKAADLLCVSVRAVNHWLKGSRCMPRTAWELLNLKLEKGRSMTLCSVDWRVQ